VKKLKKEHISKIFIIISIIVILFITSNIILYDSLPIDTIVSNLINKIRCNELDIFMKIITKFGNTDTIIILVIITLLVIIKKLKNKKLALITLTAIITNVLFNQLIKFSLKRPRPIHKLIEIGGYSFPSGHAMISMMFYGLLIYLYYKLLKNKKLKAILITINIILILLIGFSRIYLNVHYFSDVIAGYLISILYLYIIIKLMNKNKIIT